MNITSQLLCGRLLDFGVNMLILSNVHITEQRVSAYVCMKRSFYITVFLLKKSIFIKRVDISYCSYVDKIYYSWYIMLYQLVRVPICIIKFMLCLRVLCM